MRPASAEFMTESEIHVERPQSVAIIMDGNGRWASERGVSVTDGHRAGGKALRRVVESALDHGISDLVVYAFSTENHARPLEEVTGIMGLLVELLTSEVPDLHEQGVRVVFLGREEGMPEAVRELMHQSVELTAGNERMTFGIALNYGGRAEIVDAARTVVERDGIDALSEQSLSAAMYHPEIRDPDLVIRTGNEHRLSNFLIWQASYSEFVVLDTLWPDLTDEHFTAALDEYARRERRFGVRPATKPVGGG